MSPLAAVTAAAFVACGLLACVETHCPLVDQNVVIVSPDQDLQALVDACVAGQPAADEICAPETQRLAAAITCGCLPLCRRILAITDQFPGDDAITQCWLSLAPASAYGPGKSQERVAEVLITYRPSSCP